jgi:hypothetical protein
MQSIKTGFHLQQKKKIKTQKRSVTFHRPHVFLPMSFLPNLTPCIPQPARKNIWKSRPGRWDVMRKELFA